MIIEIMRLLYAIWAAGILLLWLHAISRTLFARGRIRKKVIFLFVTALFSVAWPFAVFSPEGRKILWHKIEEI